MVLIGYGASAFDISRDVATEAKEVHIATRNPNVKLGKLENPNNIWQHMMVSFNNMKIMQLRMLISAFRDLDFVS